MQVESENDSQSDKAESNRKKSPAEILGNMVYTATRKLGFPDTGSYAYGEFTDFCVDQLFEKLKDENITFKSFIDIGSGRGIPSAIASMHFPDLNINMGIDIDGTRVNVALKALQTLYATGYTEKIWFETADVARLRSLDPFECVYSYNWTFHHMPRVMQNFATALRQSRTVKYLLWTTDEKGTITRYRLPMKFLFKMEMRVKNGNGNHRRLYVYQKVADHQEEIDQRKNLKELKSIEMQLKHDLAVLKMKLDTVVQNIAVVETASRPKRACTICPPPEKKVEETKRFPSRETRTRSINKEDSNKASIKAKTIFTELEPTKRRRTPVDDVSQDSPKKKKPRNSPTKKAVIEEKEVTVKVISSSTKASALPKKHTPKRKPFQRAKHTDVVTVEAEEETIENIPPIEDLLALNNDTITIELHRCLEEVRLGKSLVFVNSSDDIPEIEDEKTTALCYIPLLYFSLMRDRNRNKNKN